MTLFGYYDPFHHVSLYDTERQRLAEEARRRQYYERQRLAEEASRSQYYEHHQRMAEERHRTAMQPHPRHYLVRGRDGNLCRVPAEYLTEERPTMTTMKAERSTQPQGVPSSSSLSSSSSISPKRRVESPLSSSPETQLTLSKKSSEKSPLRANPTQLQARDNKTPPSSESVTKALPLVGPVPTALENRCSPATPAANDFPSSMEKGKYTDIIVGTIENEDDSKQPDVVVEDVADDEEDLVSRSVLCSKVEIQQTRENHSFSRPLSLETK